MLRIVTTKTSNAAGAGVVIAKALGKQRTVKYDHALNAEQNHAEAAFALVKALGDDVAKGVASRESDWSIDTPDARPNVRHWSV